MLFSYIGSLLSVIQTPFYDHILKKLLKMKINLNCRYLYGNAEMDLPPNSAQTQHVFTYHAWEIYFQTSAES